MPLGSQHGAQNPPKTRPKSMKNRWKMDIKNDENFECILNGFLVALGANMAPKPSQNPSPRRCPLGVPLGSWRALGGLLGPLGAQEPILSIFDRFLIDFWSIFDGFLSIFWPFLNDFWMIFGIQNVFWKLMLCQLCTACWQLRTTCSTTLSTLATTTAKAKDTLYIAPSAMADCWRSPGYIYI